MRPFQTDLVHIFVLCPPISVIQWMPFISAYLEHERDEEEEEEDVLTSTRLHLHVMACQSRVSSPSQILILVIINFRLQAHLTALPDQKRYPQWVTNSQMMLWQQ